MSSEIELKFEINQNDIGSLQLFLNQWASSDEAEFMPHSASKRMSSYLKLANTYYDTADYYLRHNGCGLRIRSSCLNNHAEQFEITLKRDSKSLAGLHERAEFNVPLPSSALDLSVLPCKALPENCDIEQLQQDLTPLFTTDFKRQTWLISFASSEIEVALDMGEIIANHQSKPIQEVELELKQGNHNDLLNFAIELSRFHLHLFSQSKASRGYRLLQDLPLTMCRLDPAIEPSLPDLLKFWQQNEEYALQTDDLTFYQQMLNQVNRGLTGKNLSLEPELYQWQKALLSVSSVAEFAYSEVNTKLKLMLIALVTN